MRRYLRCPGAICCPARRALRAVLQPHIRFCDELIADALSPLPRECCASAHQLAAADAPCAASGADAFGCHTVALVLFPEAAAPSFGRPRVAIHEDLDAVHSGYPMFAAGASDQPPNSCQDGPGRASMGRGQAPFGFLVIDGLTLTPLYL